MGRTPQVNRRTNPRVIDGRVQKKNHTGTTDDYFSEPLRLLRLDRQKPGPGYVHVLGVQHLKEFIEIIPDWNDLSRGLDAVVLGAGSPYMFGNYNYGWTENGIIYLRAWEKGLVRTWSGKFLGEVLELVDRLGVRYGEEPTYYRPESPVYRVELTERQARGFMLMDVFLHEIGHHQDRVRSKRKVECGNGEEYAKQFAKELASRMWPRFARLYDRW